MEIARGALHARRHGGAAAASACGCGGAAVASPAIVTRIGERFGRYDAAAAAAAPLWVHAVSVGETRAAAPLIERLSSAFPQARILLTHMTATGRETGRALFGDRVTQAWLPYDLPFAVRAFLHHFRPRGRPPDGDRAVAEPDRAGAMRSACRCFWSTLACRRARQRATHALRALTRPMLGRLSGVAAQSAADAQRLDGAGCAARRSSPATSSSTSPFRKTCARWALRCANASARHGRVWVAASTREGEEALLLDALAAARCPRTRCCSSCRAIRSASTRSPSCCARATSRSSAAATTAPCRATSAWCSATRWGDVRLLRRIRSGVRRRQPAAVRRADT